MASASTADPPSSIMETVRALLKEFDAELSTVMDPIAESEGPCSTPITPFSEAEWLVHLELKFVLRSHYIELLHSVGRCVGVATPEVAPKAGLNDALLIMRELIEKIEARAQTRLSVTDPGLLPLILRLVHGYKLSAAESEFFQLLFVRSASKSVSFRAVTGGRQDDKEMAMELCSMSFLEVEEFMDDKRTHICEGIIVGQDNYDGKSIRMINEAVSALLLRPLNTEQRLKLSKTELLNVMDASKSQSNMPVNTVKDASQLSLTEGNVIFSQPALDNSFSLKRKREAFDQEAADDDLSLEVADLNKLVNRRLISDNQEIPLLSDTESKETEFFGIGGGSSETCAPPSVPLQEDAEALASELGPYCSSLEYLDDAFQALSLMLQIAKARHKENLKEAGNNDLSWIDLPQPKKVVCTES